MAKYELEPTELLHLDNLDSLLNKLINERGIIHLSQIGLKPYLIPQDYQEIDLRLIPEEENPNNINETLKPLYEVLHRSNIPVYFTASIGEAVINGHIHGNKRDPNKEVRVHYKELPRNVHVLVEDQGGELDTSFISFILRQRLEGYNNSLNFYEFSKKTKPEGRGGAGTMIIHRYSDNIGYYMSEKGGLILSLGFDKDLKSQTN